MMLLAHSTRKAYQVHILYPCFAKRPKMLRLTEADKDRSGSYPIHVLGGLPGTLEVLSLHEYVYAYIHEACGLPGSHDDHSKILVGWYTKYP